MERDGEGGEKRGTVYFFPDEEISADALEAFGDEGAFVESIAVTRTGADVEIAVDVESDRRTATVTFDADGTLRGVE